MLNVWDSWLTMKKHQIPENLVHCEPRQVTSTKGVAPSTGGTKIRPKLLRFGACPVPCGGGSRSPTRELHKSERSDARRKVGTFS